MQFFVSRKAIVKDYWLTWDAVPGAVPPGMVIISKNSLPTAGLPGSRFGVDSTVPVAGGETLSVRMALGEAYCQTDRTLG